MTTITDFLPKYPNIKKFENQLLNPYDTETFNSVIFRKKEFYDNRLEKIESVPVEQGTLMKHQTNIKNFLSDKTDYNSLLLVHEMGTGKTCAAIGTIEALKKTNLYDGAIIVANKGILNNFMYDILYKCTSGEYISEKNIENNDKSIVSNKKLMKKFYSFRTYYEFYKDIIKTPVERRASVFSNKIIVIDEVHNIRKPVSISREDAKVAKDPSKKVRMIYKEIKNVLQQIKNSKVLLLSGTPMKSHFVIRKCDFYLKKILPNIKWTPKLLMM